MPGRPAAVGPGSAVLVQAMSDQTACAFEKLQVFVGEGIQFIALRVEHPEDVPVIVAHRHNDLGTSRVEGRQIAKILAHVAYDDGLAGIQRRAAQSLSNRETWICRRFLACFRQNYEFILNDLVNADPAVIARSANHLHELLHSFAGAPAGQRERTDLLKLFARGFCHSRENNLAYKKPSASRISTFCRESLLKNNVGKPGIGAD